MLKQYSLLTHRVKRVINYEWDIVWTNVIILAVLHVACVYGLYNRFNFSLKTSMWTKTIGFSSQFGITIGAHRLWSHKTFVANKICQVFLMCLVTLTYQNSIYDWSRDHRVHHKYSETDADPHNANRGLFFSHIGWLFLRKHKDVIEKGKTVDMSDLRNNPIVWFQHKYYYPLVIFWAILMPTFVPCYFWDEQLFHSLIARLTTIVVSLHLTWFVNSLAHAIGNRPYNKTIGPTENSFMKYIALGEGFHNYHHTYPWDYKASEYGFEGRNLSAGIIELFAYIGWATDLKSPSKETLAKRIEATGDESQREKSINSHIKTAIIMLIYVIIM